MSLKKTKQNHDPAHSYPAVHFNFGTYPNSNTNMSPGINDIATSAQKSGKVEATIGYRDKCNKIGDYIASKNVEIWIELDDMRRKVFIPLTDFNYIPRHFFH